MVRLSHSFYKIFIFPGTCRTSTSRRWYSRRVQPISITRMRPARWLLSSPRPISSSSSMTRPSELIPGTRCSKHSDPIKSVSFSISWRTTTPRPSLPAAWKLSWAPTRRGWPKWDSDAYREDDIPTIWIGGRSCSPWHKYIWSMGINWRRNLKRWSNGWLISWGYRHLTSILIFDTALPRNISARFDIIFSFFYFYFIADGWEDKMPWKRKGKELSGHECRITAPIEWDLQKW